MSESEDHAPSTAVTVAPRITPAKVADSIPIFDSDRFAHYGRIAAVMAQSTLVPETLRAGSREEAIANCIQVVEFADRANYSPFAVAQCSSVVYGKLMFEGKLVDAMLQTKLGIELRCYFTGERGKDSRRVYVTDQDISKEEFEALRPGVYPFGMRMIDGSVDEWKTFEKGGGVKKMWAGGPQTDDQLAYKGKRTWARRYKPSVMLGVVTDDEVQDFEERRLEAAEAVQVIGAADFKPAKPRKKKADEPAPQVAETEQAHDAEFECEHQWHDTVNEEEEVCAACGMVRERPTVTVSVSDADAGQDTPASASGASDASQDPKASSPEDQSRPMSDGERVAPMNSLYRLSSDVVGDDGKVPTYKNGKPFSRSNPTSKIAPAEYDRHPPGHDPKPEDQVLTQAQAEQAQDPGEDRQEPTQSDGDAAEFDEGDDSSIPQPPHELIMMAPHWSDALQAFRDHHVKDADADLKKGLRLALWRTYDERRERKEEIPNIFSHLTLMRVWLEYGATNADEIDQMWLSFFRHPAYAQAGPTDQNAIRQLKDSRKAELGA